MNGPPTLRALTAFPTRHGKVNIPQELGVKYQVFGAQLLDDPTGMKVINMEYKHRGDSLQINTEVLQEWLRGQGRRPISWRTLIEVLQDIELGALAGDIEESCSANTRDTEPPFLPSLQFLNISIVIILVATISLLAIGYWLEKPLNGYVNVLKDTYQKQPVTDPDRWLHVVMPFIDLTLTERDIPPAREYTDHHMQDKDNLGLDEVVNSVKEGSKILIEGRPGVGKTTLLRHIAKQWAEGKNLQNFPLVVIVFLGHTPSCRITNLETILEYHSHGYPDTASVARNLVLTGGKGICFLLDGLDEYLPQEGDFIYHLIKGQTLPDAAVIVTSHPTASYHLQQHFTRKIEVVGFHKHQIQQYISALPPNNAAIVSEYLHRYTNIKHISYLPLHLAMVTYLALYSEQVTLLDLDTDTKIYHMFVNLTLRQRYKDVENFAEIHNQAFSTLSKLGFDATTRYGRYGANPILRHLGPANWDIIGDSGFYGASPGLHHLDPELLARLESFSILTINKQHEGDKIHYTFTFSHNTFQEFFAAYYLTTLPLEEQMEALELYQHSAPLMWRFFFGLLRAHTSETTAKLFEKFARIHISTAWFAKRTIIMCAYELKQTAIAKGLVKVLNYSMTFEFFDPLECAASAYVISLNPYQFRRLEMGFHYVYKDHHQEACFASMLAELPRNNEVVHVTLKDLRLADGTVSAMVKLPQYFPNLQQLELLEVYTVSGVPLTVAEELEGLRFVGIRIERRFFSMKSLNPTMFATFLKYLKNLQHLILSQNFIGDDGAVALAKGLKNKVNLQYLALEDIDIGDDGAVAIAEELKNATSLQTLNLSNNRIGDDGVVALAEGIKHLTSLQVLKLDRNRIGDEGITALAEGLKYLTSLQTLDLGWNTIGGDGVVVLAEGIKNLTSLRVELSGNRIGDEGFAALAEGVKHSGPSPMPSPSPSVQQVPIQLPVVIIQLLVAIVIVLMGIWIHTRFNYRPIRHIKSQTELESTADSGGEHQEADSGGGSAMAGTPKKSNLRGVEVVNHTAFNLNQGAKNFEFEGYGFKLQVPEGSLPAEVSETKLDVQVSLSGQFQMPPDCELVSAVYWVYSSHKFIKPLTVEIQHCVTSSTGTQSSELTFVYTKCNQKELPYTFKMQEGGVFSPHSSYGTLSVTSFSGLGIVRRIFRRSSRTQPAITEAAIQTGQEEEPVVEQYCAQLFISKSVSAWKVDFVVTKNLDTCSTIVKQEYRCQAQQQFSFIFDFKEDKLALKVPKEGLTFSGWKISPFYNPKITKKQVANFSSGKIIPKCELVLEWVEDTSPTCLHRQIDLLGAGDHTYFLLRINPDENVSPRPVAMDGRLSSSTSDSSIPSHGGAIPSEPLSKLNAETPEEEEAKALGRVDLADITIYLHPFGKTTVFNLGLVMGLDYNRLKSTMDSPNFLADMLAGWLEKVDQVQKAGVPTWRRLVEALRDPRVGQNGIASNIEQDKL